MKGLILFILAKIGIILIYPIGFVYSVLITLFKSCFSNGFSKALKDVDEYLYRCAVADDQHANTYLAKLFNDTLVKPGGPRFGNPDETISSVLGKNKAIKNQSKTGSTIDKGLESLDPDHTIKSIEKDEQ